MIRSGLSKFFDLSSILCLSISLAAGRPYDDFSPHGLCSHPRVSRFMIHILQHIDNCRYRVTLKVRYHGVVYRNTIPSEAHSLLRSFPKLTNSRPPVAWLPTNVSGLCYHILIHIIRLSLPTNLYFKIILYLFIVHVTASSFILFPNGVI